MNNTGRFCTVFQLVRICRFFYTVAIRKQNTGKFFFCVFSRLNKALNIRFFRYSVTGAYTCRNSCFHVLFPVSIQPEFPDRLTADEAVFLFMSARESNPWARASKKQSCGLFLARGAAAAARSGFRKAKSTSIPVRATKNTHCFSLNYRTLTAFQRNCKHPRQTL